MINIISSSHTSSQASWEMKCRLAEPNGRATFMALFGEMTGNQVCDDSLTLHTVMTWHQGSVHIYFRFFAIWVGGWGLGFQGMQTRSNGENRAGLGSFLAL
jgi:hypothetical protein